MTGSTTPREAELLARVAVLEEALEGVSNELNRYKRTDEYALLQWIRKLVKGTKQALNSPTPDGQALLAVLKAMDKYHRISKQRGMRVSVGGPVLKDVYDTYEALSPDFRASLRGGE